MNTKTIQTESIIALVFLFGGFYVWMKLPGLVIALGIMIFWLSVRE